MVYNLYKEVDEMEINNMEVGQRIKMIRMTMGLSLEGFGQKVDNVSRSLTSRWERGVNLPNNARLKKIAELGNLSIDELLYGSKHNYISQIVKENMKDRPIDGLTINSITNKLLFANRNQWKDSYPNEEEVIEALTLMKHAQLDRKEEKALRFGKEIYEMTAKRNEIITDLVNFEKLPLADKHKKIDEVSKHLKEITFLYESQYDLTPQEAYEEYENMYLAENE